MRKRHVTDRRFFHALAAAVALSAAVAAAAAPPAAASCDCAVPLTVNETLHSDETDPLAVTLSTAGVLTLDVSTPADGVQPTIEFLGTTDTCIAAAGEGIDWEYVQQTPKWVAIRIATTSSTNFYLRVVEQDSKQSLGDYNLRVAWVPDLSIPQTTDLSPDATDTCSVSSSLVSGYDFTGDRYVVVSDAAEQWDPDIMQFTNTVPGVVLIENTCGPDLEATLYPSTSCTGGTALGNAVLEDGAGQLLATVHEGDHVLWLTNHNLSSGHYEVALRFYATCALGDDDHGSAARCATPVSLGASPSGEIDDEDDEDWFTFVLASQTTVQIETSGTTDTLGSLYNGAGQRLEVQDGGGDADNFRIARTLGPGRFYVRVEGRGEGELGYTLLVAEDD